jgi:hypothetical protein
MQVSSSSALQIKGPIFVLLTTTSGIGGGLNRSAQHFVLEGKDGVWRWIRDFIEVYNGREDGVMGPLAARGIAQGDRSSIWQAVRYGCPESSSF